MAVEEIYKPQSFAMPLSLVVATDNSSKFRTDETLGWSGVAANLRRIEVPGSHLELFDDPYADNMVSATEEFLQQATQ